MFAITLSLACGVLALGTAYLGLGIPNHPYQWAVGVGSLALAYHRGWLPIKNSPALWLMATINIAMAATLSKLIIGGGVRKPLSWLQIPTLGTGDDPTWTLLWPKFSLQWIALAPTHWELDLTLIQSFLLVISAAAGWVRFQPFASLTALMLLLASVPSYVDFHWDWVLPAMAACCVSLYVQAHPAEPKVLPA